MAQLLHIRNWMSNDCALDISCEYEIWFRQTFPLEGNQQDSSTDCFAVN